MNRSIAGLSFCLLFCAASDAAAQGFINPFVGTTLSSPSPDGSHSKAGFGLAFGKVGTAVSSEAEIAYYPELLDNTGNALAKNHVLTFSGNLLVGPHIGRVKVYGAAGAGDLLLNVTSLKSVVTPNPESLSSNYFAVNAGGGMMGFVSGHFGIRGDLRYYRAFGINVSDLESAGLTLDHFDFWRANVGLVATF